MAQSNTIHASMTLMSLITKCVGFKSAKNQLTIDANFDKYLLRRIGAMKNQFLSPQVEVNPPPLPFCYQFSQFFDVNT